MATIYAKIGNNEQRIWKLLAYVGRYGHQPVSIARQLTVRELGRLADSVAQIVREENESGRPPWANE